MNGYTETHLPARSLLTCTLARALRLTLDRAFRYLSVFRRQCIVVQVWNPLMATAESSLFREVEHEDGCVLSSRVHLALKHTYGIPSACRCLVQGAACNMPPIPIAAILACSVQAVSCSLSDDDAHACLLALPCPPSQRRLPCSTVSQKRAAEGDMIQMVSLDTGNGTRITGMMASRQLIGPLIVRLGEHANALKRAMQEKGMRLAEGVQPVVSNVQVQALADELLQGAHRACAWSAGLCPQTALPLVPCRRGARVTFPVVHDVVKPLC